MMGQMAVPVFTKGGLAQGILAAVLLAAALAPTKLPAQDGGDETPLLGFLSARGTEHFDADRPRARPASGEAVVDLLYTRSRGKLRMLAEGEFATDDAELDRLQFGWELVPDTLLWLGKLHEPASSWNFGHDHGHYLQTAISTPAIERWADDAGALPENITGALLDSRRPMGTTAGVQVSLAIGVAPNPSLRDDRSYWLPPLSHNSHRVGWSVRLALLPDYTGSNGVGLLGARHKLDADRFASAGLLPTRDIDETVYGAYTDVDWGLWTLHSALYYVNVSLLEPANARDENFISGYAQLERRFADRYTVFARHEGSSRAQESGYLHAVQDHFAVRVSLLGARWDFARHQALTLETSRSTTLSNRFTKISLQWSAVVP